MRPVTLTARYVAFAIVATVGNLGAQRLVLKIDDSPQLFFPALLVGTIVGLLIKYVLDKRWIFADASSGLAAHGRKFSLYAVMGIATTMIFWGSESLFWLLWGTQLARECGAILGLSIGYVVKYRLDRRFVFADAHSPRPLG